MLELIEDNKNLEDRDNRDIFKTLTLDPEDDEDFDPTDDGPLILETLKNRLYEENSLEEDIKE